MDKVYIINVYNYDGFIGPFGNMFFTSKADAQKYIESELNELDSTFEIDALRLYTE